MRIRRPRRSARVEMTPLMDVVFLLLVYFIYAMMMMAVQKGLPVFLPSSTQAQRETTVIAVGLTIQADGSMSIDKEPVTKENLAAVIDQKVRTEAAAQGKDPSPDGPSVRIFADASLPYQGLYDVLDLLKAANIRKISLQAK